MWMANLLENTWFQGIRIVWIAYSPFRWLEWSHKFNYPKEDVIWLNMVDSVPWYCSVHGAACFYLFPLLSPLLHCCRVCVWLASSWELYAEHCLPCPSPSSLAWCSTSPRGISSQTLWVSSQPLKSSSSTLYSVYLDQWIIEINFVWCHWIFSSTSDYVVILLCAEFLVTAVSFKCCSVKLLVIMKVKKKHGY